MSAGRRPRAAPWIVAAIAYGAVAVALTWPLATTLSRRVAHDAGDPLLNATILWWNENICSVSPSSPRRSSGWARRRSRRTTTRAGRRSAAKKS